MRHTNLIQFLIFVTFLYTLGFSSILKADDISLKPGDEQYLAFAEVMPAIVGGHETVYKNITYPEIALKTKLEGKVYLLIYVNESGGVDDVKVVKSLGGGCDEAAAGAVKKAKFTPGKNSGVPVKVKLSMAIVFKLS